MFAIMDYKLELAVELLKEIALNKLEKGSRMWVDVIHVNNPHSFYVRPQEYIRYFPLLQSQGDRPDKADINVGEVFTYKSFTTKSIVRGKILSCEKGREEIMCKMFAMDYGYVEDRIPLENIWKTDYSLHIPPLVIHCRLDGLAPVGETWDQGICDAMTTYAEGKTSAIIIEHTNLDHVFVRLYAIFPDDLGSVLAENHPNSAKIVPCYECMEDDINSIPYFPEREMEIGEIFNVTMQSGNIYRRFFVLPTESDEKFIADRNKYTACAKLEKKLKMQDLSINSPVGVFYKENRKYERGLVKKLLPQFNTARVFMVDQGVTIEASVLNIRKLPNWHLTTPMQALWCTLHGNQILKRMVPLRSDPGVEFEMTVIAPGDEGVNCANVVRLTEPEEDTYI